MAASPWLLVVGEACASLGFRQGWRTRASNAEETTMADSVALLRDRFGIELPGVEVPDEVAGLIGRRVTRRYTEQDVPEGLLDVLLAAGQSAPSKSDLQQFSVVV